MKISRYLASPQEPEEGGHFLGFTIIEGKEGTTPAATPVDRAGAARPLEGTGQCLMAGWGAPRRGAEFESGETVGLGRGDGWQAGLGRRGARLAGEGEGVWRREIAGGFVVRAKISSGEDKVGGGGGSRAQSVETTRSRIIGRYKSLVTRLSSKLSKWKQWANALHTGELS